VPCLWFLELNQMNTKLHQTVLEGGCRTSMQELTNVTVSHYALLYAVFFKTFWEPETVIQTL